MINLNRNLIWEIDLIWADQKHFHLPDDSMRVRTEVIDSRADRWHHINQRFSLKQRVEMKLLRTNLRANLSIDWTNSSDINNFFLFTRCVWIIYLITANVCALADHPSATFLCSNALRIFFIILIILIISIFVIQWRNPKNEANQQNINHHQWIIYWIWEKFQAFSSQFVQN